MRCLVSTGLIRMRVCLHPIYPCFLQDHNKADAAWQEASDISQPATANEIPASPSQIPGDDAFSPTLATSSNEEPMPDTSASIEPVATDLISSKPTSRRPASRKLLGRIGAAIRRSPKQRGKRRIGSESDGVEVAGYSIVTKGLTHDLFWAFGRWLYGFWLAQVSVKHLEATNASEGKALARKLGSLVNAVMNLRRFLWNWDVCNGESSLIWKIVRFPPRYAYGTS